MRKVGAGLTGFLFLVAVSTGFAQSAKSMATSPVEDQLRQLREELNALRQELAELKGARGGQMPMGPGMMGRPMSPMTPEMMQPMMQMMQACSQMMAQMGGMGGMAPQPKTQPSGGREPTEHGTKQVGGLEVTLLLAPPLTAAEMQAMMPGMGSMQGMQGMGGMQGQPTHWIGVIVRDEKTDQVVQNLEITLTVRKGGITRTVKLMPMPGSYGANISLPEKGRYTVTVAIARPGQPLSAAFEFENK